MLRIPPGPLFLIIGIINLPVYTIEIRFYLEKNFKNIVGELGPVEGKSIN